MLVSRPTDHLYDYNVRRQFILHLVKLVHLLLITLLETVSGISSTPKSQSPRMPYHTSVLSGYHWVLELVNGHPNRILSELGLRKETYLQLITHLRSIGLADTKKVTVEEQTAIFLYTCVTGLTTRHVGERFQCSNGTISW